MTRRIKLTLIHIEVEVIPDSPPPIITGGEEVSEVLLRPGLAKALPRNGEMRLLAAGGES